MLCIGKCVWLWTTSPTGGFCVFETTEAREEYLINLSVLASFHPGEKEVGRRREKEGE